MGSFAWILGVLPVCAGGIVNVMWMAIEEILDSEEKTP
jgi:cyd operon protein YbgT